MTTRRRVLDRAPSPWRRRVVSGAVALALGTTAALAAAAPAAAGGGVLAQAGTLDVVSQNIVASWVDGQQTMLIDLAVKGDGTAPGALLLLVTTTQPTITQADPAVLDAFEAAVAPTVVEEEQWWLDLDSFTSVGDTAQDAPTRTLQLLDGGTSDLGAAGTDAILGWLAEAGYTPGEAETAVIRTYGDGRWWFTALAITPPTSTSAMAIPPLQVSFASDELVLPMLFSATGSASLDLRTTVVGTDRLDRTDSMRGLSEVEFAGTVSVAEHPELADWLTPYGGTAWLTTVSQTFPTPSRITQDIRFTPSSYGPVDPGTETKVVRRIIWGLPAGIVLVAGGMLAIALVGITISQVMQRRYR